MQDHHEKLRTTIKELEAELHLLGTVDAETRGLLEEALAEIEAKIQRHSTEAPAQGLLSHRLSGTAERFETTHPTLFGLVTRLADALAQLGI
jgi:hypothetical protein